MVARLSKSTGPAGLSPTAGALLPLFFVFASTAFSLTLSAASAAAPAEAVPAGIAEVEFNVLESDEAHTLVEVLFPDVARRQIELAEGTFDVLRMPGASPIGEPGNPRLLVSGTMIAVPPTSGVELRIVEEQYDTIDAVRPVPVQADDWTADQPLHIDDGAYRRDGRFPAFPAEVGEPAILRDFRVVTLRAFPVSYDAASGELRVTRRLLLELDYSSVGTVNVKTRIRPPSRAFRSLYEGAIANYDFVRPRYESDSRGSYLIITHDTFYNYILSLAEWKHKRGMEVEIAKLSVIGSSVASIKSYIQTAYDTWTVPPEFVLLVGDTEYLPTSDWDNYYGQLEGGDVLVDVHVGRFPADNVTECGLFVAKTLGYKRTPYMSDTDWFRSGCLIVREDYDSGDAIYFEDTWFAYGLMDRDGFAQIDTLFRRNGSDRDDVHAAVTDGRVLVNYRGQGVSNWWSPFDCNPGLTSPEYKLPVVMSATCGSGNFSGDGYPCETWTKAGTVAHPKGAVAFSATSIVASHVSEYRSAVNQGFYNALFNLKMFTVGEATTHGKARLLTLYPSQTYEYEGWNVQGDPELDIWTAVPRVADITHPPTVPNSPSTLPVHVEYDGYAIQEALVCAYAPGEVYEAAYTNANGDVSLSISPATAETLWITVTGHNLHPYEGYAVVTATGPYLVYADHTIDDSQTGNNDGIVTPGETIELTVELENTGPEDALGVTGELEAADSYVALGDTTADYGTIASSSTGTNTTPFTFTTAADCPNGHELGLTLYAADGSRAQWIVDVPGIVVAAADLGHSATLVIDDAPGGDGDGLLEPGETAWLMLTIANSGPVGLEDVSGLLSTGSSFGVVTDDEGAFGAIAGGGGTAQCTTNAFRVSVSPTAPPGSDMSFTLTASGEASTYQHTQDVVFAVTLGGSASAGPCGPDAGGYYAYDTGDSWTGRAPVYDWVELVGTGSIISEITNSDAAIVTITLPFTFRYYGTNYTQISVCSNGFLAMGSEDYRFGDNSGIPDEHGPEAMIAPFWDDIDPSASGDIYQWYDSANHRWICQFDAVPHYGSGNAETFEVILLDPAYYPTGTGNGEIIFQYQTVAFPYSTTVGIENLAETTGIQYLFDSTYDPYAATITSGQAIKFTTQPPVNPPVWLVVSDSTVDDSAGGDGDGAAEPLEQIELVITVDNLGTSGASSVTGTLLTTDPDVTIDDDNATFGTIGAGQTGSNAGSPFVITVGSDPSDEYVELELHLSTGARYYTYDVVTLVLDLSQTGVDDGGAPLAFALRQNSPNPFRGGTTLAFELPGPSHATLSVYNVAGRRVATVVDGDYPAGRHSVTWDGVGDNGREVSAGIYFYMLEAGSRRDMKKLIRLR
jgi:hypothetical protein